ncbi:hypothetical protein CEXT_706681 [Caerostris extrusa]|uniref:Uncharacterized protein n=1 Tax=Caerostris extrusa TaxID=172846 RepID=A0AAV4RLY6_CAEEX|nr:hypothetical protein CEXT_706681 [Caerostris extrusa]
MCRIIRLSLPTGDFCFYNRPCPKTLPTMSFPHSDWLRLNDKRSKSAWRGRPLGLDETPHTKHFVNSERNRIFKGLLRVVLENDAYFQVTWLIFVITTLLSLHMQALPLLEQIILNRKWDGNCLAVR